MIAELRETLDGDVRAAVKGPALNRLVEDPEVHGADLRAEVFVFVGGEDAVTEDGRGHQIEARGVNRQGARAAQSRLDRRRHERRG
jgi:hypothetical protein